MTTPWKVPPKMWVGQTVAILGDGPDMTAEFAESARGKTTIAVSGAIKFAPWADMFVALDPSPQFWDAAAEFSGVRVCGVECEYDAMYPGMMYETVVTAGGTIEIRNSALAAIRIAARAGAKKIILLGIDLERDDGLRQIATELQSKGIDFEYQIPAAVPNGRSEVASDEIVGTKAPRARRKGA